MASIVDNKKGFKVLFTSNVECLSWGGYAICDTCNKSSSFGYFVSVLNYWLCPECFNEWYKTAKHYEEDTPYEIKKYEQMSSMLSINKLHLKVEE